MNRQQVSGSRLGLLALVALLGAAGCRGGGDRPASVSGHVTYNGKSVTSGTVVFTNESGKASDPGTVQPDGSYSIAHAPVGAVRVSFDNPAPPKSTPPVGQKVAPADPEDQEAAKLYVPTPAKYKDPATSGLTFELKSGSNKYDVELK